MDVLTHQLITLPFPVYLTSRPLFRCLSCGLCFNVTLLNTFLSTPPFYPSTNPSVVLKITDSCPGADWCGATLDKSNRAGHYINFDLAQPSIPASFYPSDKAVYGCELRPFVC